MAAVQSTTDGGAHWTRSWVRWPEGDSRPEGMYFVDKQRGWVAGEWLLVDPVTGYEQPFAMLFTSTNGGQSWTENQRGPMHRTAHSVHFADALNGWAAWTGGIWHTTDGGSSWENQTPPVEVTALHFETPLIGWAAGGNTIVKTTDRGATWTQQPVGTTARIFAMDFINQSSQAFLKAA